MQNPRQNVSETPKPQQTSRHHAITAVAAGLICALLLILTSPGLPMAWDEGNALYRAEGIARWVGRMGPWTEQEIARDWRYTTRLEGHPALYGILIAAGRAVGERWWGPLGGARLGPILLFALAAGAMYWRLAEEHSRAAAWGAVGALVLLPRMFAHAHFASFDGPLTSCWILAWATFAPARRTIPGAVLWGIVLGMTLSAKATGWLAPLPFLAWALVYRDRQAVRALAVGVPVALAAFFLLNPPLWHHPWDGFWTFLSLNLNRGARPGLNISIQFLGRLYNLDHPLPWYNTLFWTAVTVPVPLLLLALVGLGATLRRPCRQRAAMLVVANWLTLILVRALPGVPPHDGVRLFLPSFAFLAILAGMGVDVVLTWARHAGRGRTPAWAGILLLYLGSASSLFWYAPQWLSYYNFFLGGLRGAAAVGMEPTYYWDALDRSVYDWLNAHTPPGEKVLFAAGPVENLSLARRWGWLRPDFRPTAPGTPRWYVLQNRPGAWQSADRRLREQSLPAFRKTLRSGGWGPWCLEVPLVEVYAYQDYVKARGANEPGSGNRVYKHGIVFHWRPVP